MPDWSYRTIFRPLLHRMTGKAARTLTLRAMGTVSRMPGGLLLIKTLGHMEPSPQLESKVGEVKLSTPVGLAGETDPGGLASNALAQLGFGFVEIGPVTAGTHEQASAKRVHMDHARETIRYPDGAETLGLDEAIGQIRSRRHDRPVFVRINIKPAAGASPQEAADQLEHLVRELGNAGAEGFMLDILSVSRQSQHFEFSGMLHRIASAARGISGGRNMKPLLLYVPADYPDERLIPLVRDWDTEVWTGVVVGIGPCDEDSPGISVGPACKEAAQAKIGLLREQCPHPLIIQTSAGIHEPQDALDAMKAGADHVLLNSGFVYAGPGLPKRINDAVLYRRAMELPEPEVPSFWSHWGWMCLLGIGMMTGGFIAWLIAVTSVLLPYDEAFLDSSRAELERANAHLLHFMSHDRITLAGTMISIGILYYQLARHGLRNGVHWARTALLISGSVGFPSFFLYLGYGFFDPLHAAAAAVLLPMFLLAMRRNPDRPSRNPVNLRSDRTWRMAVWGQLCFVVLGIALAVGGITIAAIGITHVFVPTDVTYLGLTPAQLDAFNPKLIPLIAHDRAGFGGALLSDAAALLATALWGLQQGARWLWKTLLFGGAPGFIAGLSVHFEIGYTDFVHLLPAYFAVFLYVAGLVLLYPYLMREPAEH